MVTTNQSYLQSALPSRDGKWDLRSDDGRTRAYDLLDGPGAFHAPGNDLQASFTEFLVAAHEDALKQSIEARVANERTFASVAWTESGNVT